MHPPKPYKELLEILEERLRVLPDKPGETPQGNLHALWHTAAGNPLPMEEALERPLPRIDDLAVARLRSLIRRRLEGEPLAYLTGRQSFMGLDLLAGPGALIPRRETELLAEVGLSAIRECVETRGRALVLDVFTGSGNLVLAYAHHEPDADLFGVDISEEAIRLACRNALHTGHEGRVLFRVGDLLEPFDDPSFLGQVDVLTGCPPYIPEKKVGLMEPEIAGYEPKEAFAAGPFGLDLLHRLIREAPRFLRPGGVLAFEVGAGQGERIARRIDRSPEYEEIRTHPDEEGRIRVVSARRSAD